MAQFEEEEIERQITQLESQELSSPFGIATGEVYDQLLGLYLLKNDLVNARFLWKRIPPSLANATPELTNLWGLGRSLWQRDLAAFYAASNQTAWSEQSKQLVGAIVEKTRGRQVDLAARAYSCIQADELAGMLGLPPSEAVNHVIAHGWTGDEGMLYPPDPQSSAIKVTTGGPSPQPDGSGPGGAGGDEGLTNADLMAKVTEFMCFIENH